MIGRMFDCSTYFRDGRLGVLVLPDAHYLPAGNGKGFVRQTVSLDISPQLRGPVPLIPGRLSAVFWTNVPEAPIYEDGYLAPGEDDVGPHPDACRQVEPVVFAVPVTEPVQLAAEQNLRLRVRPSVGSHVARATLVGRPRVGQAPRFGRRLGALPLRHGLNHHTVHSNAPSVRQDIRVPPGGADREEHR